MKKSLFALALLLIVIRLSAIEGMWLPLLLQQLNEKEMQQMGLKINAEDIYSANQASLKDAVVLFGRGCTGSIISPEGLVLTNHHCAYGVIQRLSSIESNYLEDGFWAMSRQEELYSPGLTVTIMKRMEDVTAEVLHGVGINVAEAVRDSLIRINIDKIEELASDTSGYETQVRPLFYGNAYYIFFTETFRDIRLVGAPPSNIGRFGGDTDNWMWPRHTGDFALFRIYVGADNKPADYSPDNVPYNPVRFLPISTKGAEKSDFTFVLGFPGRTRQFLPAVAVEGITQVSNPAAIELRERRLEIMNDVMKQNELVRIQYAAKQAGIANVWKRMIGENRGIRRMEAVQRKRDQEQEFMQWSMSDPNLLATFGGIIPAFGQIYEELIPLNLSRTYLTEAGRGIEAVRFAGQFNELVQTSKKKKKLDEELQNHINELLSSAEDHFKNYSAKIDRQVMADMLQMYYSGLGKEQVPEIIKSLYAESKGDFSALSHEAFTGSVFTDQQRLQHFLSKYRPRDFRQIEKDIFFRLAIGLNDHLQNRILKRSVILERQLDSLKRIYVKGLMKMQPDRRFYPDANLTLRVSYGKVEGYYPRDAVYYRHYTTIEGIMEKEDPEIYDYIVEDKLKELYRQRDYGMYADDEGQMRVCFIASNHTSGGSSGSPVLNGEGHLIGINFDRNWEGTMSDLMYDPDMCRNISLDIRFCLFIIDKFAGAGHLLDEMMLIE